MNRLRFWIPCLAFAASALGCGPHKEEPSPKAPRMPEVSIVKPQKRDLVRTVGQPGFVVAYEQSSIFPKIDGFIEKWSVDIGDRVKTNQVLATLFVPELVEEHKLKIASVELDQVLVQQAQKLVEVAQGNLGAAQAKVTQAKADIIRFQAEVDRWKSEVDRLGKLVKERVVDKQVLDESIRQLRSNESARAAADAAVAVADSERLAREAELAKAKVDVTAATAKVKVSQAGERRLAALVGYIQLTSPFEGIVVARNANTGDFVQGTSGDQSASTLSIDQSSTKGSPVYVIARTDVVRIFVDIPEMDANYVQPGTEAEVRIEAFRDVKIPAKVTRTSWALNVKTRTLRAEIDLPNEGARLLPGMYAYGFVKVKRPGVLALPTGCIQRRGDDQVGYLLRDGKATEVTLRLGVSDGTFQELVALEENGETRPPTGKEEFLLGDSTELANGAEVKVVGQDAAPAEPTKKK